MEFSTKSRKIAAASNAATLYICNETGSSNQNDVHPAVALLFDSLEQDQCFAATKLLKTANYRQSPWLE